MKPYRQYDAEFKRQAMRMAVEDGRGIRAVERELGITISVLKGWIKKHEQHRDAAVRSTVEPGSPEAEMRKLEKENRRLAEEPAIPRTVVEADCSTSSDGNQSPHRLVLPV